MSPAPDGLRIAWKAVSGGASRREVAWGLVRELMGPTGAVARLGNPCPWCGGPHGPVRIAGAPFRAGVTYAGGFAIAAVIDAAAAAAFAIDAETADSPAPDGVLGSARTIRDWVRIEAALKADGRGLRVDPAAVVLRDDGEGWLAEVPGRAAPLRGIDVAGPTGILISAAAAEAPGGRARP